jgi:hypothetical protein
MNVKVKPYIFQTNQVSHTTAEASTRILGHLDLPANSNLVCGFSW